LKGFLGEERVASIVFGLDELPRLGLDLLLGLVVYHRGRRVHGRLEHNHGGLAKLVFEWAVRRPRTLGGGEHLLRRLKLEVHCSVDWQV
jgi:hypothetical protein